MATMTMMMNDCPLVIMDQDDSMAHWTLDTTEWTNDCESLQISDDDIHNIALMKDIFPGFNVSACAPEVDAGPSSSITSTNSGASSTNSLSTTASSSSLAASPRPKRRYTRKPKKAAPSAADPPVEEDSARQVTTKVTVKTAKKRPRSAATAASGDDESDISVLTGESQSHDEAPAADHSVKRPRAMLPSKMKTHHSSYFFEEPMIEAFADHAAQNKALPLMAPEEVLTVLANPNIVPVRSAALAEAAALRDLYETRMDELLDFMEQAQVVRATQNRTLTSLYKQLVGAGHYKNEHKLGRKRCAEAGFWLMMISMMDASSDPSTASVKLTREQFVEKYAALLGSEKHSRQANVDLHTERLFQACNNLRLLFRFIVPTNNLQLALLILACAERSGKKYQRSGNAQTFSTSCRRFLFEVEGELELSRDMVEFKNSLTQQP